MAVIVWLNAKLLDTRAVASYTVYITNYNEHYLSPTLKNSVYCIIIPSVCSDPLHIAINIQHCEEAIDDSTMTAATRLARLVLHKFPNSHHFSITTATCKNMKCTCRVHVSISYCEM